MAEYRKRKENSKHEEIEIQRASDCADFEGSRRREHGQGSLPGIWLFGCDLLHMKTKYGGMKASDIKQMRELEEENRMLKQMYADISLENRALKDIIAKNSEADGETGIGRVHTRRTWDKHPAAL